MTQIYLGQTALEIQITVKDEAGLINLTGATVVLKMRKPDATIINLTGFTSVASVITYYPTDATILNIMGEYSVWPVVTFSNGKKAAGTPVKFVVYTEGI